MNEPVVAVIVGLLLSLSAGVRVTLPLLAVNLLAFYHHISLPQNMTWLGSESSVIILSVAAVAETLVHFIPAAGTWLKAMATPLSFVGGTLLMAIPLGDRNPLMQWTLAALVGGSAATFMHLGVTGARILTAPANVASLGLFGLVWNIGEILVSVVLTLLGGLCVVAGWAVGVVILLAITTFTLVMIVKSVHQIWQPPVPMVPVSSDSSSLRV